MSDKKDRSVHGFCKPVAGSNMDRGAVPNRSEEPEMTRTTVTAPDLTPPVGPFAQGVWAGELLYASGQVGQDPVSGAMVAGGIEAETRQMFENIRRVLAAAGLGFEHVIKVQVYLADMNDFAAMNAIYGKIFDSPFPARTTVQVAKLALNARVEIDVVARRS
jgi:2-iminobutanoate/2-iminopropanoate deaminase